MLTRLPLGEYARDHPVVVVGSAPVVGGSVVGVGVGASVVVGAAVVVGTVVVVASVVVVKMDVVVGAVTQGWLVVPLTVEPPTVIEVASTLACAMTDPAIVMGC